MGVTRRLGPSELADYASLIRPTCCCVAHEKPGLRCAPSGLRLLMGGLPQTAWFADRPPSGAIKRLRPTGCRPRKSRRASPGKSAYACYMYLHGLDGFSVALRHQLLADVGTNSLASRSDRTASRARRRLRPSVHAKDVLAWPFRYGLDWIAVDRFGHFVPRAAVAGK